MLRAGLRCLAEKNKQMKYCLLLLLAGLCYNGFAQPCKYFPADCPETRLDPYGSPEDSISRLDNAGAGKPDGGFEGERKRQRVHFRDASVLVVEVGINMNFAKIVDGVALPVLSAGPMWMNNGAPDPAGELDGIRDYER